MAGMAISNLIAVAIIITTAATPHANGTTDDYGYSVFGEGQPKL